MLRNAHRTTQNHTEPLATAHHRSPPVAALPESVVEMLATVGQMMATVGRYHKQQTTNNNNNNNNKNTVLTMATTANERATIRSRAGLSRELEMPRDDNRPHPSRGGSPGYDLWLRHYCLDQIGNYGMEVVEDLPCCRRTIYNWINRIHPFRSTGNQERTAIVGRDLLFLSIGLFAYPTSSEDELAAFIANQGGDIYSRQEISKRLADLELSKKIASTEAYDAFTPRNRLRVKLFWTRAPPLGVVGVETRRLINFDEFGMSLNKCNPNYGHSHTTIRIRKPGHYTKTTNITVLVAVESGDPNLPPGVDGSTGNPRRWITVLDRGGTTSIVFAAFCDKVLSDIEQHPAPGDVDNTRYPIWDNLASHHTALVSQPVEGRPSPNTFIIVPRPPYQPKFGPIEYVICEIAAELARRAQPNWTTAHLRQEVVQVFGTLGRDGKFWNTFEHCGYD